jgi:PEP-CTERM/exosortase A-associated glycosyltransferase
MRILHVLDHSIPLQSGYTFRTKSILEHQRKMSYETIHLTGVKQGQTNVLEEVIDGLLFYRTPVPKIGSNMPILKQVQVITSLKKRIEELVIEYAPDVIHAHSPVLNALAALPICRKYKIPLVYEVRAFWEDAAVDLGTHSDTSLRYKISRAIETFVFKRAQAITTICDGLKNEIISRGIPKEKITVIPNAVNIDEFIYKNSQLGNSDVIRNKFWLEGKTIIGYIGSLYHYEGLVHLVKGFSVIKKAIPNAKVLIVGGGPEFKKLKKLAHSLQLSDDIIFTGRIPHQDINDYYDIVDYFVYPRLRQRLTDLVTPLKPLESMARGKCVIASDVGGHKELISDNENGVLFKSGSSNALARAVIETISRKKDEILVPAAREYVEKYRNWTNSTSNYKQVYEDALEG